VNRFTSSTSTTDMPARTRFLAALALFACALATSAAQAHGIWFAQRATQLALLYGIGSDDLDSVKRLPLVRSIAGYDAEWKPIPTTLRVAGPLLLVDSESQPTVVAAVLFNGIWSKTPEGEWLKKGRDEVPNATTSEKNFKYAVRIVGPLSTPIPPLPGQTLQIIPVDATLPVLMGKPLKLRVLFQGKPVAGARVMWDWLNDPDGKPVKTAADGTVTVKVRNQGLNVITAIFDGPSDEPTKADKMEHLATLSFVLPHAPE
jgi:nickel transport protein